MNKRHSAFLILWVGVPALLLNLGAGLVQGLNRPMESDAFYFKQLAVSLAGGGGYVVSQGFWPSAPSLQRLPGWPAVAAVALRTMPGLPPDGVMRGLNLVINAGCAVAVGMLAYRLLRRRGVAVLAGCGYALHPMGLACADEGLSEPLHVFLLLTGTILLHGALAAWSPGVRADLRRVTGALAGFLLLGLACLVRANFARWIVVFGAVAAIRALRNGAWNSRGWLGLLAAGALVFALPSLLWAARNYRVCGAFPVLSALRGQTFYGGNNVLTASPGMYWGFWVFPNAIPGETPLYALSRSMSEYEVDCYYHAKGIAFLREHPQSLPSLLLGKLVRAYVPIPWHRTPATMAMAAFRWGLYIMAAIGLWRLRGRLDAVFAHILAGMVLANVFTVVVFYGYSRFAFTLKPFLLPLAALAVAEGWLGRLRGRLPLWRLPPIGEGS